MTMGSQQAAMLAAQTGEFGLPGLMSTGGSATYAGAGGPLAKMAFSSGSPFNSLLAQPVQRKRISLL
jgi:hypothetical protein